MLRKLGRRMMIWVVIAAFGVLAVACATQWGLRREETRGPRGADGVMEVARAREIDPPDGRKAEEAILLVHGFVGGPDEYNDLGERLAAEGYHVRLMRLPGHGTTPREFAAQTSVTMVNAVRGEYAELRKRYARVSVGGFSMGGSLATLLASETDVHRLLLIAPYYGVTYHWYYGLKPETWNGLMYRVMPYTVKGKMFVQVNKRDAVDKIYTYRVVPTAGVNTLILLGEMARSEEVLKRVRCPVLLLAAEGDQASAPEPIRAAFAEMASGDKQAVWFGKKINHHILYDWEADRAKAAVVRWFGEKGVEAGSIENEKQAMKIENEL